MLAPEKKRKFINDYTKLIDTLLGTIIRIFSSKRNLTLREKGLDYPFDSDQYEPDPPVQLLYDNFKQSWIQLALSVDEDLGDFPPIYAETGAFDRLRNKIRNYYRDNSNKLMFDINAISIYYLAPAEVLENEILERTLLLPDGLIPTAVGYNGPDPSEIANFEDISL